jgi:hypothetical protein
MTTYGRNALKLFGLRVVKVFVERIAGWACF